MVKMTFYVGLHQPADAKHFPYCFISVNRLRTRKSGFKVQNWILDSGAFTEVTRHGGYRSSVGEYAGHIKRVRTNGNLVAAVAQDYMCEPFVLERTGLTVADHQRLTIERYDALLAEDTGGVYIMPVLQGYRPSEYVDHIRMYGERLRRGMYVGVGSVCKRNSNPTSVELVLKAIKTERPDLQLHGFGLKVTALRNAVVVGALASADSMSWSYDARREGRNANDWREALGFVRKITQSPIQLPLYQ